MCGDLFLYGTLRDADVFRAATGRPLAAFAVRRFELPGYRAARLAAAPFPVLVPAPAARAPGLVIARIDRVTLTRLVRYEGPAYELVSLKRPAAGRLSAFMPVGAPPVLAENWRIEEWRREDKALMLSLLGRHWRSARRKP